MAKLILTQCGGLSNICQHLYCLAIFVFKKFANFRGQEQKRKKLPSLKTMKRKTKVRQIKGYERQGRGIQVEGPQG